MTKKKRALELVRTISKSVSELSMIWSTNRSDVNEMLEGEYPFSECFDEMELRIMDWEISVEDEYNKGVQDEASGS